MNNRLTEFYNDVQVIEFLSQFNASPKDIFLVIQFNKDLKQNYTLSYQFYRAVGDMLDQFMITGRTTNTYQKLVYELLWKYRNDTFFLIVDYVNNL